MFTSLFVCYICDVFTWYSLLKNMLTVLWSLLNLNSHKTSEAILLIPRASQLQVAFADCAADIKSTYESQDARQKAPDWPANALNCIAVLFLRAGRTQEAW